MFQKSTPFIFFAYSTMMKKKVGTVAWLTSGGNKKEDSFTKQNRIDCINYLERYRGVGGGGDAGGDEAAVLGEGQEGEDVSDRDIKRMLERMKPYMDNAPGTQLYFSKQRLDLMVMLTSPAVSGRLKWFMTEAQPDTYMAEIFDNIVTSDESTGVDQNSSIEERRAASDRLTLDQRRKLLLQCPVISARLHKLHQDAFWTYVLNGEDKPLGKSHHTS